MSIRSASRASKKHEFELECLDRAAAEFNEDSDGQKHHWTRLQFRTRTHICTSLQRNRTRLFLQESGLESIAEELEKNNNETMFFQPLLEFPEHISSDEAQRFDKGFKMIKNNLILLPYMYQMCQISARKLFLYAK